MPPDQDLFYLVIPAYREAERLPSFLEDLVALQDVLAPIAIVVVEDSGSGPHQEATLEAIAPIVERSQGVVSTLSYPENIGKGGAIKAGWDKAPLHAAWLAFIDADGSLPPDELVRMAASIRARGDAETAYFASRIMMLGRRISRHLRRHLMGRIFATLSSNILNIKCYDSQCGLKCIPAGAYDKIRPQLQTNGFGFDIELLAFLTDEGVQIEEFPVDWFEVGGSSVNFLLDPIKMLFTLAGVSRRRKKNPSSVKDPGSIPA